MNECCGSILRDDALLSTFNSEPHDAISAQLASAAVKLPIKRSLVACAFLLFYSAVYFAAGFAGVRLVGYAWSAIFR